MEERQDAKDGVVFIDVDDLKDGVALGEKIAMSEDDTLGVAGGAGGVKDDGGVVRGGGTEGKIIGRRGVLMFAQGHEISCPCTCIVQQDDFRRRRAGASGFFGGGEIFSGGEEDPCAAVAKQRSDLRGLVGGVERNGDGAETQQPEIGGAPVGVVVSEDGGAVAAGKAASGEKPRGGIGQGGELGVGVALERLRTLDFDGNAGGETTGGVGELFVEAVHRCRARLRRARGI